MSGGVVAAIVAVAAFALGAALFALRKAKQRSYANPGQPEDLHTDSVLADVVV